jgi:hypothetical protein
MAVVMLPGPPSFGVPATYGPQAIRDLGPQAVWVAQPTFVITGTTNDLAGNVLAGCRVAIYQTSTDNIILQGISDSNGYYRFDVPQGIAFYVVAYKAGSPDVVGTTVNTLTGV